MWTTNTHEGNRKKGGTDNKYDYCPPTVPLFLYLVVVEAIFTGGWVPAECGGCLGGVADGWVGGYSRH